MFQFHTAIRRMMAVAVASVCLLSASLQAGERVVSLPELRQDLISAAKARRANVSTVEKLFSSKAAASALKRAGFDGDQIVKAAATLSDDELARLSDRASSAQQDFAAGALSNQELTYIVIALATAVIILVIVAA